MRTFEPLKSPVQALAIPPEGSVDIRGTVWRENGSWQIMLSMPRWVMLDVETEALDDYVVLLSRPVELQDSHIIDFNREDETTIMVFEVTPNEMEVEDMMDDTCEAVERSEAGNLADAITALTGVKDMDEFEERAQRWHERGVHFSPKELAELRREVEDDLERRGSYAFLFDGKEVPGIVGEYQGLGMWKVSVRLEAEKVNAYAAYNAYFVNAVSLEELVWLLAAAFAVGRGWDAFIDPTRGRNFKKRKMFG